MRTILIISELFANKPKFMPSFHAILKLIKPEITVMLNLPERSKMCTTKNFVN
jgi:hypothetical protein